MDSRHVIHKSYRDNALLRGSFNALAKETFGLDFEDWYQNGYWGGNYIPYSVIDHGIVVANASVNIMSFDALGLEKKYIQIGTVMTAGAYRNQGLSRLLLEEILRDYKDKTDGFFLFANDTVLDFYPRFGFRKAVEYQCSRHVQTNKGESVVPVPMRDRADWKLLEEAVLGSAANGAFELKQNVGLIMFYVTKFMSGNVFFIEDQKAYVIAGIEDGHLTIFNVFSPEPSDINQIIEAFGAKIKTVSFGFTPRERDGLILSEARQEDTTLFLLGKDFDDFEQKKIMFPLLGHA